MGYGTQALKLSEVNPILLTDEQLNYEYAVADALMREAAEWGPVMEKAERRQAMVRAEINRRSRR